MASSSPDPGRVLRHRWGSPGDRDRRLIDTVSSEPVRAMRAAAYEHPALRRAHDALLKESWREALVLLNEIIPGTLGSEEIDARLVRARLYVRTGMLDAAEAVLIDLHRQLPLYEQTIAQVWAVWADCLHLRGEMRPGMRLALAAEKIRMTDPTRAFEVYLTTAHLLTHVEIDDALRRYAWLEAQFPPSSSSARARMCFEYAEALLAAGEHERALAKMLDAQRLAQSAGATVTLADCLRRMPLLRLILGQDEHALTSMQQLHQAGALYDAAGDRGGAYLPVETAEVHRGLGRLGEAADAFRAGLRAARGIGDRNRMGHALLGQFEITRMQDKAKTSLWDDALVEYRAVGSDWGAVHLCLSRALAEPANRDVWLDRAEQLVHGSTQSPFVYERDLIKRYRSVPENRLLHEPHHLPFP